MSLGHYKSKRSSILSFQFFTSDWNCLASAPLYSEFAARRVLSLSLSLSLPLLPFFLWPASIFQMKWNHIINISYLLNICKLVGMQVKLWKCYFIKCVCAYRKLNTVIFILMINRDTLIIYIFIWNILNLSIDWHMYLWYTNISEYLTKWLTLKNCIFWEGRVKDKSHLLICFLNAWKIQHCAKLKPVDWISTQSSHMTCKDSITWNNICCS